MTPFRSGRLHDSSVVAIATVLVIAGAQPALALTGTRDGEPGPQECYQSFASCLRACPPSDGDCIAACFFDNYGSCLTPL